MNDSPEQIANLFAAYLRDNKADAKHVFRVISWLGMLALAIDKVKIRWWIPRTRQLHFEANINGGVTPTNRYKVRYCHVLGSRGGLQIVEINSNQVEVGVVAEFASLYDVERFYQLCSHRGWYFGAVLAAYAPSVRVSRAPAIQAAATVTP